MAACPYVAALLLLLVTPAVTLAQAPDQPPDPSGSWRSEIGELSVMLAGDALSFSYAAVFGATAHTCDGAGVAGLDGDGRWVWTDESGTVELVAAGDGLEVRLTEGVASFCGAGWGGDAFRRSSHRPPIRCTVEVERSHLHVVDPLTPARRRGYVVEGDEVQTAPVRNLELREFVLARFVGPRSTTAGLLRLEDLSCPKTGGE